MFYKELNKKGVNLNLDELKIYLEKIASDQILKNKSNINTYPIPSLRENFEFILKVYNMLNEHIKLGIPIHPAGEWLLDNFYIIEETKKNIIKELSLKKYRKFISIANGEYMGFARIYALCFEIVVYTDYRINAKTIIDLINSYQNKKTLTMEEIWSINIFMQISLISGIADICKNIYYSQLEKYKVESIVERYVDKKQNLKYRNIINYNVKEKSYIQMKYSFIEYMSFVLKKYGKAGIKYINILEEQVNKLGSTLEEVINKEHFNIATNRVSMANAITSMKELSRINFKDVFEKVNGVEEILKKDPSSLYEKMDYKTKEYYRQSIAKIAKKAKMSEIYIANCALNLSKNVSNDKQSHIGYYLIDKGKELLYKKIGIKKEILFNYDLKVKLYIYSKWFFTFLLDFIISFVLYLSFKNIFVTLIFSILSILINHEIINKISFYLIR